MVQGPLSRIGKESPLALHQLRLGESVCGATARAGGSLAGVCANGVAGSLTAANPEKDAPGSSDSNRVARGDHPRNRLLSANVN